MTKVLVMTAAVLAASSVASAQTRPGGPPDVLKARYNVSIMEGVLERAVREGAAGLIRQIRAVSPDMLVVTGAPRARGFRLDGYGVFFDIDVPALRRSVAWSLRTMLDQNGMPLATAMQQLRTYVRSVSDPAMKRSLEQALRRIELQVGPAPTLPEGAGGVTRAAGVTAAAAPGQTLPLDAAWVLDPAEAYTEAVKNALIEAMLHHSSPMDLGPDEWLTVAARDNEPGDRQNPADDVSTIVLRIKGGDIKAFRAGTVTLDEAKRKVEVKAN